MAEYVLVESLKTEISNYYFTLKKVWARMSIFEKEAEKIIDQLQEHLQQAEICQRVDPGFLELPPTICSQKMKSQLLEKIYSKCLSNIILLESELDVITNEVLPGLYENRENSTQLYEALSRDHPCSMALLEVATSEHISLKLLFDRLIDVDVAFKVRSDRMRSALHSISRVRSTDSDQKDSKISSNNVSVIFDHEEKSDTDSSTLSGILNNFVLGSSGNKFDDGTVGILASEIIRKPASSEEEEVSNKMPQRVSSQLNDAFVWTPEEKNQITYFLSQAELLLKELESSQVNSSKSRQSPAPKNVNLKKKK